MERNPIALIDKLSIERINELEKDREFLSRLDSVSAQLEEYMSEKPDPASPKIAYFSMEYGLHSSLKIYSGGLGILAGDYLKEASDKNHPMVAVGLLYRYGYFTQQLSSQGSQVATYEAQNFFKLPISPVRDDVGNWVSIQIVRSRHAYGSVRWAVRSSSCSIRTTRQTSRRIARLHIISTAATGRTVSSRSCCWVWAVYAR